jgi:type I restriction enzyme S subunit
VELKPGYKVAEVGVIPEEWESITLEQLASFTSGRGINIASLRDESSDTPIPVYGGNGIAGYTAIAMVEEPTIVVGRVGQRCGEVYLTTRSAWITDNALYPRRMLQQVDVSYLALALKAAGLNTLKNRNELPLVTQSILHAVSVAVPQSQIEQNAIAFALSDVDALLEGLTRLIAKKRDLKQAAMQQLLTGQTRLPGFTGEWEMTRLGDHVEFLRNGTNSRAELTGDGIVKYLHYGDIHGSADTSLSPDSLPSLPTFKARSLARLRDGDLVIADASEDLSGVGKSVEMRDVKECEVVAGLHTIAARFDTRVLANGFKAYLQFHPTFVNQLRRLAAGTKVYATTRSHVGSIEMSLPTIQEQVAISAVLSDMDAEITALEARFEKTIALKHAMMQELLTGRTRLV